MRDNRASLRYDRSAVSVFDKLEDFIRTIVDEADRTKRGDSAAGDPDYADAWQELDEYMNSGGGRSTYGPYRDGSGRSRARPQGPPDDLREHFRNLEVEFGASLEQVQATYKRLIRAYHPDRFGSSPEKQRTATEIIKRINYSYHQILAFYRSNNAHHR